MPTFLLKYRMALMARLARRIRLPGMLNLLVAGERCRSDVQVVVTGSLGLAALAAPLSGLCAALLINVIFGAAAVLMWAQQYKQYDFSYSIWASLIWIIIKRDPWTLGRGNTAWIRRRERGGYVIIFRS